MLQSQLVGCFGLNRPLRQYFSLYSAVSQRGRKKREMLDERKNVQTTPPAPTASAAGPYPILIQISRTPQHRKFTQHHRTTRPPPCKAKQNLLAICIYCYKGRAITNIGRTCSPTQLYIIETIKYV